jgi:hypothetical protein
VKACADTCAANQKCAQLDGDTKKCAPLLAAIEAACREEENATGAKITWSIDANASWTPASATDYLAILRPYQQRIYMVEQPFPLFRSHPDGTSSGLVQCVGDRAEPLSAEDLAPWVKVRQAYEAQGMRIYGDER